MTAARGPRAGPEVTVEDWTDYWAVRWAFYLGVMAYGTVKENLLTILAGLGWAATVWALL